MPTDHPITPLPMPRGTRRVLLVGGTFDPPHIAHAQMALAARRWLESGDPVTPATLIAFVPAARSPLKAPPIADDAARVEMVRAMASEVPGSIVWTDEIDRARPPQPGYWIDTLERARAVTSAVGGVNAPASPELCFLIGADQAISLHRWRDARRLLELARPVIVLRPPINTRDQLDTPLHEAAFWTHAEIESLLACVVRASPTALTDLSASAIRVQLAAGHPLPDGSLSPRVLGVINARGLYRFPRSCHEPRP